MIFSARKIFFMIITGLLFPFILHGQDDLKKLSVNGYVKFLQTVLYQDFKQDWLTDNLIHNRINVHWYPSSKFNGAVEFRNRFIYGDFVKTIPEYKEMVVKDNGFVDLSFNWSDGKSYLFNTTIDRIYVDYITGKFQARIGRQRINWSQNLVWNPNDVFNAYSYFDFDYEERPGTDAVKLQYYTGFTSYGEFVYQLGDSLKDMSFAGLYKFNQWNYDFQFLGGYVKNNWIVGTGWSGNIKGAAFRGEATYFYVNEDSVVNRHQVVASISGDYTFKNQLYAQIGIIYNSLGATENIQFDESMFFGGTSAKNLTPSRMELFGQVSYPFTPLISGNFATIANPYDGSFFFGPGFTFSIQKNMEILLFAQFFEGDENTEYGDIGKLLYWRLRWSF
jgi:hypothetical protein